MIFLFLLEKLKKGVLSGRKNQVKGSSLYGPGRGYISDIGVVPPG